MKVQFIRLSEHATLPSKATKYSAGYDLHSPEDRVLRAGNQIVIKIGLSLFWDDSTYYGKIESRSGLCYNYRVSAEAGVIDYDFRKEIGVIIANYGTEDLRINKGDRIAQLIFKKCDNQVEFEEVLEFPEIDSTRNGGFGSTGMSINIQESKDST